MKKLKNGYLPEMGMLFMVISLLMACHGTEINYAQFKEAGDHDLPLFHSETRNKSVLLVFPHPDDEIVCGGTIAALKQAGWAVHLITFTQGNATEKSVRSAEWNKAIKILGIDDAELYDLPNNTWENVLNNRITFWYEGMDSLEHMLERSITRTKPSMLITYDTALGAYGHPEHRIAALAAYRVFDAHRGDSLYNIERILQITLPEKEEQLMLAHAESYRNAIKLTGNTGLPEPRLAFDILKQWPVKRLAACQYASQENTLKKFFLWPDPKDTLIHYQTFDREYFFEIKK